MHWLILVAALYSGDPAEVSPPPPAQAGQTPSVSVEAVMLDRNEAYLDYMIALEQEIQELREQLADARLDANESQRELDELNQFLRDHQEYGKSYEEYRAVKAAAEDEARRKQIAENRRKRDEQKALQRAKFEEAQARKKARNAERDRLSSYSQAGFGSLGLDVWLGRSSYYYGTKDSTVRVKYDPDVGLFYRPDNRYVVDYSHMTISGSILNTSNQIRNIGVAIVFFDSNGAQVGGTTVQVNNARPEVPYPFTTQMDMALDRAFSSSTSYILYADPVE